MPESGISAFIGYAPKVQITQRTLEQAKYETIGAQEDRPLDIAMKVSGDERCFIHQPENYYEPLHKRNPYGVGTYKLKLVLRYKGGQAGPFLLTLKNGAGTDPTSLKLTMGW